MKNLQQLKEEKRELVNQLRIDGSDEQKLFARIKHLETQIKDAERIELLQRVNMEQARKRELAIIAWECEQPTEDVTTDNGSLHKTKVRKYPKLAASGCYHVEWKDGRITELKIGGERFTMHRTKYEYGKPNQYTRPASFNDFLELNSIMQKDLTIEEFNEAAQKVEDANREVKAQMEAYKRKIETLGIYSLSHFGLFGQNAEHFYTYSANK